MELTRFFRSTARSYITTRLTQAKELGEAIVVNGKSVSLPPLLSPLPVPPVARSDLCFLLPVTEIPLGIPSKGSHAQTDDSRVPDIPLGRPGSPEEGAAACLFLASGLSAFVSGHTLEVTGGRG